MQPASIAATDAAIVGRLIKPDHGNFSAEAAHEILDIRFDDHDQEEMRRLSLKAQEGTLTPEEQAAVESYRRVGYILGVLWSKARLSLKQTSSEVDHGRCT